MTEFAELFLTCADRDEAEKVAEVLLSQHLIACVKFDPIESKFLWKGNVEAAKEVRLSMLSLAANFDNIEAEVAKLHSYDTFVLQAMPIARVSGAATDWLNESISK